MSYHTKIKLFCIIKYILPYIIYKRIFYNFIKYFYYKEHLTHEPKVSPQSPSLVPS